jgi:hypothetical protein
MRKKGSLPISDLKDMENPPMLARAWENVNL